MEVNLSCPSCQKRLKPDELVVDRQLRAEVDFHIRKHASGSGSGSRGGAAQVVTPIASSTQQAAVPVKQEYPNRDRDGRDQQRGDDRGAGRRDGRSRSRSPMRTFH